MVDPDVSGGLRNRGRRKGETGKNKTGASHIG
jgi:hypothetical protein